MINKFSEQSDVALIMNWARLCNQHNQIFEQLEEAYLSPSERDNLEIGLDNTSEIIELAEAIMTERNMFDADKKLKAEFSKYLAGAQS